MKKITLCLFAIVTALLGCQKNNTLERKSSEKPNIQLERLSTASDFEVQKQIFNLMAPSERYSLWDGHLQNAKNQFTNTNESKKVALIEELLAAISVSVFDNTSTANSIFENYFLPTWQSKADTTFSAMELFDLTYDPTEDTIGYRTAPPEIGGEPGGGPSPKCFCHAGTSGLSCTKLVITIPPSITFGTCERTNAYCKESDYGCGRLWLWSCDGNHCQY
ncbi:MAG: bacteriocin fulvocin C-related protein [Bacteroidota bacterium]